MNRRLSGAFRRVRLLRRVARRLRRVRRVYLWWHERGWEVL